jgi:hypothetical protein
VRGEDTLARGRGGSIFWKTPDNALYTTYVNKNAEMRIIKIVPCGGGINNTTEQKGGQ